MSDETKAAEVTPGSDEYHQQMADKYRNQGNADDPRDVAPEPKVPALPEGGHDKFYNKETGEYDWANHAKELQYRLEQQSKKTEGEPEDNSKSEAQGDDDQAVSDIVTKAGLNPQDLETQIMQTGALSKEAKEALVKQGIPEALIDQYVDNYVYRIESQTSQALEYAGGDDGWKRIEAWALENLSDQEKQTYNAMLGGPNWKVAIDTLKTKMGYSAKSSSEGRLMSGSTNSSRSVGYRSRAEMKADMADPRYRMDPQFRKQVYEKMQTASFTSETA